MTAVKPKQRYGILEIKKNRVNFFDNSKETAAPITPAPIIIASYLIFNFFAPRRN